MKTLQAQRKQGPGILRNPILWMMVGACAIYAIALTYNVPPIALSVLLAGVFVAILALQEPGYAAAAMVFIVWSNLSDVLIKFHGLPSVAKPLVGLLLVVLLLRRFSSRPVPIKTDTTLWWLLAYLFIMALGMWYAPFPENVAGPTIDFAKDIVVYLILLNLLSRREAFNTAMWLLIIVGAVLGSLTIYQEITGTYDLTYGGLARVKLAFIADTVDNRARAAGPLQDPNFYAQIMLLPLALGLWGSLYGRNWRTRTLAIYAAAVSLGAIVLSFSRGGYVAATVMLLLFAFHIRLNPRYLVVVPVLLALLYVAPPAFQARFATLFDVLPSNDGTQADTSVEGRTIEMLMGVNVFADHPIVGVGQANFAKVYPDYLAEYGGDLPNAERNTHSLYLQVAAEHGLIGLIVLVGLLGAVWNRLLLAQRIFKGAGDRRMAELAVALQLAFVGYVITSIFLHDAYPTYLWIQVALAATLYLIAKRSPNPEEETANVPNQAGAAAAGTI